MRHQKPPVSSPGLSSRRFAPQLPKKAKAVLPSKRRWGPAQTLHGSPRPSDTWPDGHTCASLHARLPACVKRRGLGLAWRVRLARGSVPRSLSQGRCEPGGQHPSPQPPPQHTHPASGHLTLVWFQASYSPLLPPTPFPSSRRGMGGDGKRGYRCV